MIWVLRGRRAAACIAVAFGLVVLAGAAAAQQSAAYFGLKFPRAIGGAQIGEPHDFESKNPGLGYSVNYRLPGGWIDVYIYDLRQASIPDDATSEPVRGQLLQATKDVFNRKGATNIKAKLRYALLDDTARVRFLCTSFIYSDKGTPLDSYLCVTSWKNKFVKFRMSTRRRAGSDAVFHDFMKAWIPVLWPS